jgi:hypothetical protein
MAVSYFKSTIVAAVFIAVGVNAEQVSFFTCRLARRT